MIVFLDSTNHYNTVDGLKQKWDITYGTVDMDNSIPPSPFIDKYSIHLITSSIQKNFSPYLLHDTDRTAGGLKDIFIGFNVYSTEYIDHINGAVFLTLKGTNDVTVKIYLNGKIKIGTKESLAGVFSFNAWNFFELHYKFDSSSGIIKAKLNGNTVIDFSGDTGSSASNLITGIKIESEGQHVYLTNFYLFDSFTPNNDFAGVSGVLTLKPNGDSATNLFTPSTGSDNYACVDEQYLDITDYISGIGTIDFYTFENLSQDYSQIFGVQIVANALKINMGDCKAVLGTRINNTGYPVSQNITEYDKRYLSQSAKYLTYCHDVNPDSGQAWTKADIDGAEFGIWNYGA